MRGIFFDEDDARAVAARLTGDGYDATVKRERLAGEDDDEDHPWAVLTDAPSIALEILVDEYDGWLDDEPDGPEQQVSGTHRTAAGPAGRAEADQAVLTTFPARAPGPEALRLSCFTSCGKL